MYGTITYEEAGVFSQLEIVCRNKKGENGNV